MKLSNRAISSTSLPRTWTGLTPTMRRYRRRNRRRRRRAVPAAAVVDAEYRVPYLAHAPMEPMNCTAWMHDDVASSGPAPRIRWVSRQRSQGARYGYGDVTVHNEYLGGGFGRRAFSDYTVQAARIAEVPYPVKLIWSREEDMRHDHYRQASISRFKGALESGKPVAWHNHYVEKHDLPRRRIFHMRSTTSSFNTRKQDSRALGILAKRRPFAACVLHRVIY